MNENFYHRALNIADERVSKDNIKLTEDALEKAGHDDKNNIEVKDVGNVDFDVQFLDEKTRSKIDNYYKSIMILRSAIKDLMDKQEELEEQERKLYISSVNSLQPELLDIKKKIKENLDSMKERIDQIQELELKVSLVQVHSSLELNKDALKN